MPKTFVTLVNETEQELQDTGNKTWTAAEIGIEVEQATREVSEYDPHVTMYTMEFESRTGIDTAGTSGSLTDTTESQFLDPHDEGKVVFNTTDRTWAVILSVTSTSVVALSKDIMASGENYVIYDRNCWNNKQLYIGDIVDYVGDDHGVIQVEYPIGNFPPSYRNFSVTDDVLTVMYDSPLPDSATANSVIEVNVWIQRQHLVSQLTGLIGAVDVATTYAAGVKKIHIDSTPAGADIVANEVVAEGTEFTIASDRGVYQLTAAATFTSSEADIYFWPPLQSLITDEDLVTFRGSTLSQKLERLVVEFAAGRAAISKAMKLPQQAFKAIDSVNSAAIALVATTTRLSRQVTDVASGRTAAGLAPAIILEANAEIDKMSTMVEQAVATLDTVRPDINTVFVGGSNTPGSYATQAAHELATSRAHFEKVRGFLEQAGAEGPLARTYIELGAAELAGGAAAVNEALGYLEKASLDLAITDRTREFTRWGQDKIARVIQQLERGLEPTTYRRYSRG